MPFCPPPTLLDTSQPIFPSEDPGLEALVHNDLGDPDDLLNALDAILADPLGAIDDDENLLSGLDVLLAAIAFNPGAFDAAIIAPLIAEYGTLTVAGDLLAAATAAAMAAAPPQLTAPSPPAQPDLPAEAWCAPCQGDNAGNTSVIFIDQDGAPAPAQGQTTSGGDCLNPTPGGGYAPGPCPSQTNTGDQPPPDQPPPDQPPPDQPPPDQPPPDQPPPSGGGTGGGTGAGDYGSGDLGGLDDT